MSLVVAKPLTRTDYQSLDLTRPSAPSAILLSPNKPIVSVNTSTGVSMSVQCDGARFGYSPNLRDCQSAMKYIHPDSEQRTWKERDTPGLTDDEFPLPYRVMGGNYVVFEGLTSIANANIAFR